MEPLDRLSVLKIKNMASFEIAALEVKKYNPLAVILGLVDYIKELEGEKDDTRDEDIGISKDNV